MHVANPRANASELLKLYRKACSNKAAALVTPELSLTGATCGDLMLHVKLLDEAMDALASLAAETERSSTILVVGLPLKIRCGLYNVLAVLQNGEIKGFIPKENLVNFGGVSESRVFCSAHELGCDTVKIGVSEIPIGTHLSFNDTNDLVFSCVHYSDLTSPNSYAADLALGGANILFVSGAQAAGAGSALARKAALEAISAQYSCVCAFANAPCSESTTDMVFDGQRIVCENGRTIASGELFERDEALTFTEICPAWMDYNRRAASLFSGNQIHQDAESIDVEQTEKITSLKFRKFRRLPFVPEDETARAARCEEILNIQTAGLAKRIEHTHSKALVIGLSGGLDSTLALLVCARACDLLKLPRTFITAVTMPGMGMTSRTHDNAKDLALALKTDFREIPIGDAVIQHFKDIGHDPKKLDVVYENSQARERTQILMDLANERGGLVVGTGDLSEIALGWSTYNGDHMSMYAVNADVPKTLIRYIVEHCAQNASKRIAAILRDVNATPVSPELLPGGSQKTEGILGSYDLHDFFLYHFIRHGETKENLLALARATFDAKEFPDAELSRVLDLFLRRFFTQQFKRNCSPDGPKVGSVALSPRGEWVMPSDAESFM
ncbi:MAG: NAD(+) synthase [Lentisphaeria bacterium]|nr:NAD(+) synthase [Lentisphaeria bacterium]